MKDFRDSFFIRGENDAWINAFLQKARDLAGAVFASEVISQMETDDYVEFFDSPPYKEAFEQIMSNPNRELSAKYDSGLHSGLKENIEIRFVAAKEKYKGSYTEVCYRISADIANKLLNEYGFKSLPYVWAGGKDPHVIKRKPTGEHDNNGKIICVGDIVRVDFDGYVPNSRYITKETEAEVFINEMIETEPHSEYHQDRIRDLSNCTILGNIFENPELAI